MRIILTEQQFELFLENKNLNRIITWEELNEDIQTDILENIFDSSDYLKNHWNFWTFKENFEMSLDLPKMSYEYKNVNQLYIQIKSHAIYEGQVEGLMKILKSGQELNAILVSNDIFIDGGHRLTAYKKMNKLMIPTINIDKLLNMDWEKWLNGLIDFD